MYMHTIEEVETVFTWDTEKVSLVGKEEEGLTYSDAERARCAMIELGANEVVYLIPKQINKANAFLTMRVRCTGTANIRQLGSWSGTFTDEQFNLIYEWGEITGRLQGKEEAALVVDGNASGGKVYIDWVWYRELSDWSVTLAARYPNKTIVAADGTISNTFGVINTTPTRIRVSIGCAGDGVNNISIAIKVLDKFGTYQTVSSFTRSSATVSTITTNFIGRSGGDFVPTQDDFVAIKVEASTTSVTGVKLKSMSISYQGQFDSEFLLPVEAQNIATPISVTSGTLQSTTVLAASGKMYSIKSASFEYVAAAGGGQVQVLYDDAIVLDRTASGTYTIPDTDQVQKIVVKVKGDGAAASTVVYRLWKYEGMYLIRR